MASGPIPNLQNGMENIQIKPDDNVSKKMATVEEIENLLQFIGGFKYWNLLNDDCRIAVIKHLDFQSRYNLGKCSKANWEINNAVPINISRLTICKTHDSHLYNRIRSHLSYTDSKAVLVTFGKHNEHICEFVFVKNGSGTKIFWCKGDPMRTPTIKCITLQEGNFFTKAVELFEKLMKRCNFEMEDLFVQSSSNYAYPIDNSIIKSIKCKYASFYMDDMNILRWWMQRLPEELRDFKFVSKKTVQRWMEDQTPFPIPQDILAMPQIVNTPRIHLYSDPSITDETFMNLKARKFYLNGENITDNAINKYLKRWTRGEGVKRFKRATITGARNLDVVLRGLNYRMWSDAFMAEFGEQFIEDYTNQISINMGRVVHEENFQVFSRIRPFDSLTVRLSGNHMNFWRTGFQMTDEKGEPYAEYDIPYGYTREYV